MTQIKVENLLVGGMLFLVGLMVSCLNISVLIVLVRCGFLTQKQNGGIYILAFANLIGDTIQQLLVLIYVGPSSIAQSFLVDGDRRHPIVLAFAYVFLFIWYEGIIIQSLIAVDRLLNVVFASLAQRLSLSIYVSAAIFVYIISALTAILSQLILPCCTVYIYYGAFGYSYLGDGFNYSDEYIDIPLNSFTTFLTFACYFWIYWFLRQSRLLIGVSLDANTRRKHKEGKISLQFGLIASVLAFTWISFRVFPLVLPQIPQVYCFVTLGLSVHCASNSFVFLTMNKEFRRCYIEFYTLGEKQKLFYVFNYTPSASIFKPSAGISSSR